jgi:uncharacterized membrane protein YfcA
MSILELAGYLMVFIIGVIMGMIGAGGSILTSSILIYVFSINPVLSASYTLLNVGIISVVGVVQYFRKDQVDIRTGLLFAVPALLVVFLMRRIIMPAIPSCICRFGSFQLTKELLIMIVFALVMIIVSWSMIRQTIPANDTIVKNRPGLTMILPGGLAGIITGFTGAGGGFVIVPALVFFTGLDIKKAVGTSLFIISINTATGFIGDYTSGVHYDWPFLFKLISVTVAGMIFSGLLANKISNTKLRRVFGITILVIGCWIVIRELVLQ